jgi:phosphatidylinositol alpha-mannosyltransferase
MNGAFVNVTLGLRLAKRLRSIFEGGAFDLIHIHGPLEPTLPLAALMALRELRCPAVGTFHMSARISPAYEVFGRLLQRYACRLSVRIAVSRAARDFALKYFPGDYELVPNGVDFERFAACKRTVPELEDGRFNFLFVGRFDLRKNVPWLISAFKQHHARFPGSRLILVGSGFTDIACRIAAHHLTGNAIHFAGRVPASDLPRYYRSSHVFCSVPRGSESFGIVLLEAMAAGRPVIGTGIEGYREIISDGRDGVLVKPGDGAALVRAMDELSMRPETRAAMGVTAQKKAAEYDWSRIAERTEHVYADVCGLQSSRVDHGRVEPRSPELP